MTILVTGGSGMVGGALARRGLTALDRAALDVTCASQRDRVLQEVQPDRVVFCAAMTHVDACATDPRARRVNVEAPIAFARLVPTTLVSTNYVFGTSGPHGPADPVSPVCAYGQQKAEAEVGVLAHGGDVIRSGWLFGSGGRNFPSTLAARLQKGSIRALAEWPVQPTWVEDLVDRVLEMPRGLSHAIGGEETTWAEVAGAIALELGCPQRVQVVTELPLGPRPKDARLTPADLPGWTRRIGQLLSLG